MFTTLRDFGASNRFNRKCSSGPIARWLVVGLLLLPLLANAAASVEAWRRIYSNPTGATDKAYKVAYDSARNAIVVGQTDSEMLIIKYSDAGVPLWTNRHFGTTTTLAVDGNDNVYVAGSVVAADVYYYAVIKYTSSGVPVWTNNTKLPGIPTDAVVTAQGNLVVTSGPTIALSPAGIPLWTNSSSGTANVLAADANGNVIVAGFTPIGTSDYIVAKYSSSGVQLWTNRYNGPGNSYDNIRAVAVDHAGNTIVTGSATGNGTGRDYTTIAYSEEGVPLWTNRFGSPGAGEDIAYAVAVDANNNVFVTGSSFETGNGYNFATIKYSNTGTPLWTNRYNNEWNMHDFAFGLVLDLDGNVLVTGTYLNPLFDEGITAVKYSNVGVALWTNRYDLPFAVHYDLYRTVIDGSGNVCVAGSYSSSQPGAGYDFFAFSYSSTGASNWACSFNGTGNRSDTPTALAVDSSGNVFVTGGSYVNAGNSEYGTVAYSASGVPLWTNRYGSGSFNQAQAIVADPYGRVIVTGGGSDMATVAYDAATGSELWTARYDGPTADVGVALAVGSNGVAFVTGASSVGTNKDFLTTAYSVTGVPLWTNRFDGPTHDWDGPRAIDVGPNGDVYVTGEIRGANYDWVTIAYSSTGVPQWTNYYNGSANKDDFAYALAVDRNTGNVYVSGLATIGTDNYSLVTIAYSAGGVPLWTRQWAGTIYIQSWRSALAVDDDGNVIVSVTDADDYLTLKYSGVGNPLWTNRYRGTFPSSDVVHGLGVDHHGTVFVTGNSSPYASAVDFVTVAYSGAGTPLWTNRYDGPARAADQMSGNKCLAVSADGGVIVIGSTPGVSDTDYAVVKYVSRPTVTTLSPVGPTTWSLTLSGMPGSEYVTQYATNLTGSPWFNLSTNAPDPNGAWTVMDASAPTSQRFYRAGQR